MQQQKTHLEGISHVELRVRRLDDSAAFYCQLFDFQRRSASPPSDRVCHCVGVPMSGGGEFSVVLVEGLPQTTEIAGLDHVSFCAQTEQGVRAIHARAVEMGARCTAPYAYDGFVQTFVFDPDGYKLEIASSDCAK